MLPDFVDGCDQSVDGAPGAGLAIPLDLMPSQQTGMSPAVQQAVLDRLYVGNDQHGPRDEYFQTGKPVHDFPTYLDKAMRHLATAIAEYQSGATAQEDHLAAVACDILLAMQHRARGTDKPKSYAKSEQSCAESAQKERTCPNVKA